MTLWFAFAVLFGWVACGPAYMDGTSASCKAYVNCYEATGGVKGSLDSTYGAMGNCWSTTTAAANACRSYCETKLIDLMRAFPDAGCHP